MSRYVIPASQPEYHVVVGFDDPLETFFVWVDHTSIDPDDEDPCLCWLGTNPGELRTIAALAEALAPYATLSATHRTQLQQDYAQRIPPTPLQRHMIRMLQRIRTMP